ncbi:helix-turn-helix transcriptional regulator [uncultured Sphaerochaeta sp.]|uniref:helix-turn-helix domain-containing protein n=1 Tax=uncultured Sphaerochaeta sp. TaxID=886478 RepID=UPI0029CA4215|nr:helix-turn-helix transcriptional regulator [uncultured Sphaerochaeta sp.]
MMKGYIHTFIVLRLSKMKLSQSKLAEQCGVSVTMVNLILTGRKKSAPVQAKIAAILGFPDWKMLEASAKTITPLLDVIYNRPTYGEEAVG